MTLRAKKIITAAISLILITAMASPSLAVRIKDLASVRGVRSNQLIGYGLVVGLKGTGDKSSTTFTTQGLSNMLKRMGLRVTPDQLKIKNVAAVLVTADLPPFARVGNRVDVTLSSLGDCTTLEGGTLIMTQLKGLDNRTYVVAQGPISVGGFQASGAAASVSKNHPTVGRIPRGGVVEREIKHSLASMNQIVLNLNNPDFTTANRMAASIRKNMPNLDARAVDSGSIAVLLPLGGAVDRVGVLARLEAIQVTPDQLAKVVVDERTGTVVMGEKVRINTVAVASGALSISVTEGAEVSQALPFAPGGETVVTPRTEVEVGEENKMLRVVKGNGVSIGEVVKALNALGATPRDLISILQAIKAAGALQAELEVI